MAQVPVEIGPSVAPASAPPGDYQQISASPSAFGGMIGAAQQQAGAKISQGANDLASADMYLQGIHNQGVSAAATNYYIDQLNTIKNDYGQLGAADQVAQQQATLDKVAAIRKATIGSLQNPVQVDGFLRSAAFIDKFSVNQIATQGNAARRVVAANANIALAQTAVNTLTANPTSDDVWNDTTHKVITASVASLTAKLGQPTPQEISATAQKALGAAAKARYEAWFAQDPTAATNWVETGTVQIAQSSAPGQPQKFATAPVRTLFDPTTLMQIGERAQRQQRSEDQARIGAGYGNSAALPPAPSPDLAAGIAQAANTYGVPPDYLTRAALLESAGGKNAGTSSAGASGDFQLKPSVAAQFKADPNNPGQAAAAAAQIYRQNLPILTQALGAAPTEADMYLAHQQGATGAIALLTNPTENAVAVLSKFYATPEAAKAAIVGNGGTADMTAGQFTQMWATRFGQAPAQGASAAAPTAISAGDAAYSGYLKLHPTDFDGALHARAIAVQQVELRHSINVQAQQDQVRARKVAEDAAVNSHVNDFLKTGKIDVAAINADPNLPGLVKMSLVQRFQKDQQEQQTGAGYGNGYGNALESVLAPTPSGPVIKDANDLVPLLTGGQITPKGYASLRSILKERDTPEGPGVLQAWGAIQGQAKAAFGDVREKYGAAAWTRYTAAASALITSDRAAGVPWSKIIGGSGAGTLSDLYQKFAPTPAQKLLDQQARAARNPSSEAAILGNYMLNGAAPPPNPEAGVSPPQTLDQFKAAYSSGFFGYGSDAFVKAKAYGIAHGWVSPSPSVPTGG